MRPLRLLVLVTFTISFIFAATTGVHAANGKAWIKPSSKNVHLNTSFDLEIHVKSKKQKLGAYNFTITFDNTLLNVDTTLGTDGVSAGRDGFITAVNTNNGAGNVVVNGFNVAGTGPGNNLRVLVVHFKALSNHGKAKIGLSVESLVDVTGATIEITSGKGSRVTVR